MIWIKRKTQSKKEKKKECSFQKGIFSMNKGIQKRAHKLSKKEKKESKKIQGNHCRGV